MDLFVEFKKSQKLGNHIYPILFQDDNYYVWMPPSQFLNEMQMSTEDRMEKLRTGNKNKAHVGMKKLHISPEIIVFQNYQPEITQSITFSIMNTTQKMLSFKVDFEKTPSFQMQPEKDLIQLAPGMKINLNILFTPVSYKDYLHKIILETARDSITLPIICIGPRPMLDIPDKVILPTIPVKKESTNSFFISNVGAISAILSLKSTTYFHVSPQKMFLPPGERIEITVTFKTNYPGSIEEDLLITLESGEQLISKLICKSVVLDVCLQKSTLEFPRSYIDLVQVEEMKIINKSKHTLLFTWMKDKTKSCTKLNVKSETINANDAENVDKKSGEKLFVYSDRNFKLFPMHDEIPPFTEKNITVSFSSKFTGKHYSTAYCDVSGNTERLPLMMSANCVGPFIVLDPTHMVVDLMFGKIYKFSVKFSNQGEIDGEITFKRLGSNFGTRITSEPSKFVVKSGEKGSVTLTILAHNPGPYIEDVCFEISKSLDILKLTLKGVVSSPKLRIEPSSIPFGDIPLGFKGVKPVSIKNLSDVAFDLHFKIATDGKDKWVDVESIGELPEKFTIPQNPKEFTIHPEYCTLYPTEVKQVAIELVPAIQRQQVTVLELFFHDSESNPMTIPVQYNAMCPNVVSNTPTISLKNCYIKCQVISTVTLRNVSDVKGYFYYMKPHDKSDIECSIVPSEGVFDPNQQFCLDLFLRCSTIGKSKKTISIQILGASSPLVICDLEMEGVGPKVTCSPKHLHWGEVSLLHKSTKILTLYNECSIDAIFKCRFKNRSTVWDVNIKHGVIRAGESIDIAVSVLLTDAILFWDKLIIDLIYNSKSLYVPVSAKGINSCIVMEPNSGPRLEFGKVFTYKKNTMTFRLKNLGTKTHQIKWSNVNEFLRKKEHMSVQHFQFNPSEFKLATMESKSVDIECYNEDVVDVQEHWYMFGIIEYGRRELLKEIDVSASFVHPSIEKSKDNIYFEINRGYGEQQFFVLDYVFLKNSSPLDMRLILTTKPPFQLVCEKTFTSDSDPHKCATMLTDIIGKTLPANTNREKVKGIVATLDSHSTDLDKILNKFGELFSLVQETSVVLQKYSTICVNVLFNENTGGNKRSRLVKDNLNIFYEDSPGKELISLIGEVNIPDIELSPGNILMECKPTQASTINFKIKNTTPLVVRYELFFHKFSEKLSKKPGSTKITKNSQQMDPENKTFVVRLLENCLLKGLFSSEHKHYYDMESIIMSIVNLLPDDDCDENEHSYRKILNIDPRKKFIHELSKKSFIENLIVNGFLMVYGEYNAQTSSSNMKMFQERHNEICQMLNGLISLNRREGELSPFGSQEISALFRPFYAVDFNMKLLCFVECGPTKLLSLRAVSGEVQFTLDKDVVDFGVCLYYQTYSQTITLNNSGSVSFELHISHPDESELFSKNPWDMKILEVSPNFGKLSAGQSITFFLKISPGIFGKFQKVINFNLADYKPIAIPVTGLGTFPQVDVATDYSYHNELEPILQYHSISHITEDWLNLHKIQHVKDINKTKKNASSKLTDCKECPVDLCSHGEGDLDRDIMYYNVRDVKYSQKGKEKSFKSLGDDWVVVANNNAKESILYPSLADIKFTIERALISEQVKSPEGSTANIANYSLHTFKRFLDFGVVTYDQTVKRKFQMTGYSFCNINLKIINKGEIPSWLKFTIPKVLNNECTSKKMVVAVLFLLSEYPIQDRTEFNCTVYIQVEHGAIIPVVVKVTLALPTLHMNSPDINFGTVLAGDLKVCSVPILNRGVTPCTWTALFLNKSNKSNASSKTFPYQMLNSNGTLKPYEHDFIRISFRPKKKESHACILKITIEHNPKPLLVNVLSESLQSDFNLIGSKIDFKLALPYSKPQQSFFGVYNPNSFPIKMQFHDSKRIRDAKGLNHKLRKIEENGKEIAVNNDKVYKKVDAQLWSKCEDVEVKDVGTFIICYQTGSSESFPIVRTIRNELNLPLVSIDSLLLTCIASQETESSTNIRKSISQTYMEVFCHLSEKSFEDDMDRLENEVNQIHSHYCETHTDVTATKKLVNKKLKLQQFDKLSSTSSGLLNSERTINVSEDLVLDVLKHTLTKYKNGCVISDLNSMFIDSQSRTLKLLLQSLPPSSFVHFFVINEKIDENIPVSQQARVKSQISQKKLKKLLDIVENWDTVHKCICIKKSKSKVKSSHSVPKKLNKKPSQSADLEKDVNLDIQKELGVPTWVLNLNNMGVIGYTTNIIKQGMEAMKYSSILNKQHGFAEFTQVIEATNFKHFEEPFDLSVFHGIQPENIEKLMSSLGLKTGGEMNLIDKNDSKPEEIVSDVADIMTIAPKSVTNFKIVFKPQTIGTYFRNIFVACSGFSEIKSVVISGVCDVPRISSDPYLLFSKVVEFPNASSWPAYDVPGKTFNFGSMFCKLGKECVPLKEIFNFKNISSMDATITLTFLHPKSCFSVSSEHLIILQKETEKVIVSVKPKMAGVFKNTLICLIDNNPTPFKINLIGLGITPQFKLSQDTLEFGKLLLYRQENKAIFFSNPCPLPLQWKIRNLEDFHENLFVSKKSSCLNGMSSEEIKFFYGGNNPTCVKSSPLYIDVYEKPMTKKEEPKYLLSKVIKVSMECYDVKFECVFVPETETHLNFGQMPVGTLKTKKVFFKNKGTYDIIYKILTADSAKLCADDITAKPNTGLLKPNMTPTCIEITWKASYELKLTEFPLLNCQLIDVIEQQKIIAMFPLNVSVENYFN